MSDPIKVGDLVMVARPQSCGCTETLGYPFKVLEIVRHDCTCTNCFRYSDSELLARIDDDEWRPAWVEVASLIKIDPPAQEERVEEEAIA